jgi:hypothetical protein
MKQCPKCKSTFEESLSAAVPLDEMSAKLLERQKTSDLCFDCLLAELMIEMGKIALASPPTFRGLNQ